MKNKESSKLLKWLIVVGLAFLAFVIITTRLMPKAEATNPCEKFCADQRLGWCADWDWRLCHHNPSQTLTKEFQHDWECENHTGTPHSGSTFDTYGACPVVTSTPTSTPTGTPTSTPTSTPTATPTPPDEPDFHSVCREYSCVEVEGKGDNECKVDLDCEPPATPSASPTPTVTRSSTPATVTPSCPNGQNCENVCTLPLKPADAITGTRLSDSTVRFSWYPSTDSHDKQTLLYGPAPDQLLYSIFDLPSETGYYDVNIYDMGHWWFSVGTWKDSFIVWSNITDP